MSINKLLKNIDTNDEINKINEIIDAVNTGVTITVDSEISSSSENPVQNKVIASALDSKQETLVAGDNITIAGNTISASNTGSTYVAGDNITITGNTISATDTTYSAGEGISIENGTISSTQTSAEWGNITGTLSEQTDLSTALSSKQDVLTAGTGINITNNVISATGATSFVASCPALTPVDDIVTWEITHNLGTQNIAVSLYYGSREIISKNVLITSNNTVTVAFSNDTDVSAGDYKAVILSTGGNLVTAIDDNQWVNSFEYIVDTDTSITGGSKIEYDLSNYLPDDNYNYEVIVGVMARTSTQLGYYLSSDLLTSLWSVLLCICKSQVQGQEQLIGSSASIFVNSSRKIYLQTDFGNTTSTLQQLWVSAYRRVSDTQSIVSGLDVCADKDLSNITNSGKATIANMNVPSNTYIDLVLGAHGSTYTAPADGFFSWNWWTVADGLSFMNLNNLTKHICTLLVPNQGSAYEQACFVPVEKGDTVYIGLSGLEPINGAHTKFFRFIYAKGSESEAS